MFVLRLRAWAVFVVLLTACTSSPSSPPGDTGSTTDVPSTTASSETSPVSESDSESETSAGTETETGALEVHVQWIEVAASDYKLELVPEFDPAITAYEAIADGPDISVYIDVIVDADIDDVLVNGEGSNLVGFRTWRSETELISPTSATIEVLAGLAEVPIYSVEIVAP